MSDSDDNNNSFVSDNDSNGDDDVNEELNESSDDFDGDDDDVNEELQLQNEIEEIDFNSLLKARKKLEYTNSKKNSTQKQTKTQIMNELKTINKNRNKNAPREYSALIKPKYQYKDQAHLYKNTFLTKKLSRDPRFDDLSGKLNEDAFNKNYNFVKELSKDYITKLNQIKKSKKYKKKLSQETYDLLNKQKNYVSGWINTQKVKDKQKEKQKQKQKKTN